MAKDLSTPNAAALAASATVDDDTALYESVIETPRVGKRSTDENSAFTLFRTFMTKLLSGALKKGAMQVRVGRLIQGAVDAKIFDGVEESQRYRRGYNYFTQQRKSLPDGWTVQAVNGKNTLVYSKALPK